MSLHFNPLFRKIILILNLLLLSACASLPGGPTEARPEDQEQADQTAQAQQERSRI